MCVFFTYTKDTYSTYLFIYLQTNSQVILSESFQSLNRFHNTLCGNEFYWRLKIYKDFLETPGNIFNISCLQNAVWAMFNRGKRKLVGYLHIFKPEILFTENREWLYMRNFAKIKKNTNLSFGCITYECSFCFTSLLLLLYINRAPKQCFFINRGSKKSRYLDWEEPLDEVTLIRSWCWLWPYFHWTYFQMGLHPVALVSYLHIASC